MTLRHNKSRENISEMSQEVTNELQPLTGEE